MSSSPTDGSARENIYSGAMRRIACRIRYGRLVGLVGSKFFFVKKTSRVCQILRRQYKSEEKVVRPASCQQQMLVTCVVERPGRGQHQVYLKELVVIITIRTGHDMATNYRKIVTHKVNVP